MSTTIVFCVFAKLLIW